MWTTAREKVFIDNLGTQTIAWNRRKDNLTQNRLVLMKKYLAAMSKRVSWDTIDPKEIRAYVKGKIAALEAKLGKERSEKEVKANGGQ